LILFLTLFYSCQKDIAKDAPDATTKLGVVSLEKATKIAENFYKSYYAHVENKEIEEHVTAEENGIPLFYVFNFKKGGFLVLSAEYGETPILANGLENHFPKSGKVNPGIGIWLVDVSNEIKDIKAGKVKPYAVAHAWSDLENGTYKSHFEITTSQDLKNRNNSVELRSGGGGGGPVDDPCTEYWTHQVGPLMTTTWGQLCLYNSLVPESGNFCEKAPTGCVATSMAQIMKFHNFPSTLFSFNLMPNRLISTTSTNGVNAVATLMEDCGDRVDMDFGPDESGADTGDVESALEELGYSTDVAYSDYTETLHLENINNNRPVILRGCTDVSCFLGWCWGTGSCHAWVSDGYQKSRNSCYGIKTLWHMNWGWDTGGPNGFYFIPKPVEQNWHFQWGRKILHNIHI
jgi:hypothetical protein